MIATRGRPASAKVKSRPATNGMPSVSKYLGVTQLSAVKRRSSGRSTYPSAVTKRLAPQPWIGVQPVIDADRTPGDCFEPRQQISIWPGQLLAPVPAMRGIELYE